MSEYEGIPDDDIWNITYEDMEIKEEIAGGSFGKVYRGIYLGMDVAIKQIFRHNDPAYMKYIEREISVLKSVRHPYIVSFCGVCLHDSGLYIVTEYIDGGDVRSLLKSTKPSWLHRVQIASDLAKSMYYLHSKKIIHRDLKSKNLLLGKDGRIRLCDFGFARLSEFKRKRVMTICGTPGFVAPEIMLGQDYDETCDVFSYGNVLAELITLLRPGRDFWLRTAETNFTLNFDELRNVSPKDCPPAYLELALRCCDYDASRRPTFAEILKDLQKIEAALPKVPVGVEPEPANAKASFKASQKSNATMRPSSDRNPGTPQAPDPFQNYNTAYNIQQNEDGEEDEDFGQSYIFTIQSEKLQLTSGENQISNKHLVKMIQRATNPDYIENDFVFELLLTYPCFTTPIDMLHCIAQRYQEKPVGKDEETISKKHKLIQIRTIVFLNTWVEKFADDFLVPGMTELVSKLDEITRPDFSLSRSLEKNSSKDKKFHRKVPNGPKKPFQGSKIPQLRATDLSIQLTLIFSDVFRAIAPREFLKESWKKRKMSHLREFLDCTRQVSRLVATCLVSENDKEKRIQLLTKFLDVAQGCMNLKNFEGVFAIARGLTHPAVERLSATFKGLSPAWSESLKQLKAFTSKEDQKQYKLKQEATPAPCVPYIEMFLEEITFLDSTNPDISKGGIINFSKHQKMARIIRHINGWGTAAYSMKIDEQIFDLLINSELDDDDVLRKKSLICEPPSTILV